MMSSDSQVVDALQRGGNLERVLRALGCDTSKDNGSEFDSPGGFIHCPMPDHPDRNESVSVVASIGVLECRSLCGTIRPLDLVVEHGKAADRGEAAKWIEDVLGMKREPLPPPVPVCDNPSLSVAQYLALRGLPDWIATEFQLQDVRIYQRGADKGEKHVSYETGWYGAVFMPTRPGRRPRVRSSVPKSKLKWAPKVRFTDGRMEDFTADRTTVPAREYPLDLIGIPQFSSSLNDAKLAAAGVGAVLIVVEGESDVHALHAMGMPYVVGVPGTKTVRRVRRELMEAALLATCGDTDLSKLTVIVWQEPGSAGSEFPKVVAATMADDALERGFTAPKFATLHHAQVEGAPKDPASMLSDLPVEIARRRLSAGLEAVLPSAGVASTVDDTPAQSTAHVQAALDVLQVDGLHTPPPATADAAVVSGVDATAPNEQDVDLPAELGPGWSAESVAAATTSDVPAPAVSSSSPVVDQWGVPLAAIVNSAPTGPGEAPVWEAFDVLDDSPERDLAPHAVEGFSTTFHRSADGWMIEKKDKDGDVSYVTICGAFVVEQVERCSDEILVRVAAPFGGAWNRVRFSLANTADAGRTCAQLASVGVLIANRQRPAVTDLLTSLARERENLAGAVHVPAGTGWSGRPGTSDFGGIDVEPVNDFGARMYQSNLRRRERQPDTKGAAHEWWTKGVEPLLGGAEGASAAAPLMALGAAAAAPLVGPLAELGVAVAPVVWIAGLGGGGKSVTQKLAASIFAPSLPDLDGQIAYFANANISQAALSARVDSCRDLPLTLDDVTQLPPAPGSTSRGDAARIEAAAALGMLVFNRKPIERATREGGIRQTRAFRSSAIFSAEVNMSSESSKAIVTAGQRRRISTIEARPMSERGLGQPYAELVNDLSASVGGAPGELLVARIREVVAARELHGLWQGVRSRIAAMPQSRDVTLTQRESLAMIALGFGLLAQVSVGADFDGAVARALTLLGPYMDAGAGAGGATKDNELSGVNSAVQGVEDMLSSHPHRFDRALGTEIYDVPHPLQGYLGRVLDSYSDGTRRVLLLRAGMEMLNARYGATMQIIEQAQADGICKQGHQTRMADGSRPRGTLWLLPPLTGGDEPDIDPTLPPPHNTDPHGLAAPLDSADYLWTEKHSMGILLAISTHGWIVPARMKEEIDAMGRQQAARFVFETGRDAMLAAYTTGHGHRDLPYTTEDNMGADTRFLWSVGMYAVGEAESCRGNVSIHETIRRDSQHELEALRGHYQAAAVDDPEGALGEPIPVADFPAADDPNWQKISGLGRERALSQWKLHLEALWRAQHSATVEEARTAHLEHVKHQRIHLMCRVAHPEWFITDMAELGELQAAGAPPFGTTVKQVAAVQGQQVPEPVVATQSVPPAQVAPVHHVTPQQVQQVPVAPAYDLAQQPVAQGVPAPAPIGIPQP